MKIGVKGAIDRAGITLAITKIPWLTMTKVFQNMLQFWRYKLALSLG
jgi:hypothetical protein